MLKHSLIQTWRVLITSLFLLGVACQSATANSPQSSPETMVPSALPVAVTKTAIEEPIPSPTPFTCTPLPMGMNLHLNPLSATLLQITIEGLQPNEEITILFTSESPGRKKVIENPNIRAGGDGRYTTQELLPAFPESEENHWQISVIHSRGIACAEASLPGLPAIYP
jgi:hypothetical protein